jgi:predicted MFS family arabinose efflux permease
MTPFLVLGIVFPTYFVRIPSLKLQLGLSDQALGLLLTVPAFSAVIAIQLGGSLVARFGSSAVLRVVMVALPLALLCLPVTTSAMTAGLVLAALGALDGMLGVGMNTHAVTVERRLHRPIMSSCHAGYSVTAVVAATLGGVALGASTSPLAHVALAAAIAVPLALVGGRAMLPPSADRATARGEDAVSRARTGSNRWLAGWNKRVLLLGAMAAVVLIGESAVGSWSGVYLHEDIGVSLAAASAGYIGFSLCHAGGRMVGDRLESRFGAAALLRAGWLVAGVGLAIVVVAPVLTLTITGFALFGLGLATLLPVILRMAGHEGADATRNGTATALSNIGSMTYAGMLFGPVVIGGAAQWIGLRQTFAALLLLIFAVLGLGQWAAHRGGPTAGPRATSRAAAARGPARGLARGPARGPAPAPGRTAVQSAV